MFIAGTPIWTNAKGDTTPIETLEEGSRVFDQFSGKEIEIERTLTRTIDLQNETLRRKEALFPFALLTSTDRCDGDTMCLASPKQQFLHAQSTENTQRPASVDVVNTLYLAKIGLAHQVSLPRLTYVALFTRKMQYIGVGNMLAITYATDDLFEASPTHTGGTYQRMERADVISRRLQ